MDSKTKNQLIGFTGCLSFFTFIAFIYIIWKGLDVAHCPMIHALLLSAFGMSTYSFENVVKERDSGRIYHIKLLLPRFLTAHRSAVR